MRRNKQIPKNMVRKKMQSITIQVHPDLFNIMEKQRLKFQKKGININQINLSRLIAKRLTEKQKNCGLYKNGKKK